MLHHDTAPPKGAVWLSFDDGFKEMLENVVPLSRERHIPITVFIPSGIIEGHGLFPWLHRSESTDTASHNGTRDSITLADVKQMAQYPEVSLGSHTVGHIVTMNLSDEQARYEFSESKRALESWGSAPVRTFAYPEGRLSGTEDRFLAECGYLLAVTTEPTFVTRQNNPYFVPRFHVGDNISYPEAICNMVGVWRPAIDPLLHLVRRMKALRQRFWPFWGRGYSATGPENSAA